MTFDVTPRLEYVYTNRGEPDAERHEVCAFCLGDWPCSPDEHRAAIVAADAPSPSRSVEPVAPESALAEAVSRVRRFVAEWPLSGGHPDNIYSLWVHGEDEPRTLRKDDLLLILAALTRNQP